MVNHKTFEEWEKHYDYLIKELGYSNAIPRILGRKKILFNNLKLKKLILELGFNGIIPSDYGKKLELKQNLEKHEKKNDDESYAQDSYDFIRKNSKEEYKDDVKKIFVDIGFEILFEDENCIFAKNIHTSYTIFCVKSIEEKISEFNISESTLTSFLKELNKRIEQSRKKKEKTSKHSTDNSHYNDFRLGALTDFGWRAKYRDVIRKESLIKKICADGIVSTLRTLNNLLKNRYYEYTLDSIKKDIAYVESLSLQNEINTNDTLYKFRKNMYTLKPELEKNYEVPSRMFFIKLTRKKSDIC